jgi:hypothetical protein
MKHLIEKLAFLVAIWLMALLSSCSNTKIDYNNPDVETFVKQLKRGEYDTKDEHGIVTVPRFKEKDIPALLSHADDLTLIPNFPTMYNSTSGKIRLGECLLWIVETIRLGSPASMGCNMVEANADNYEAIYFLTDAQVVDAVERYRYWWENRQLPRTIWTIDPCYDEPLCGSGYRWW